MRIILATNEHIVQGLFELDNHHEGHLGKLNHCIHELVADVGEVPNKSLPSNNRIENDLHDDNDGTLSVTKVASIHGSETFKEGRRSCDANTTNENYPAPASGDMFLFTGEINIVATRTCRILEYLNSHYIEDIT